MALKKEKYKNVQGIKQSQRHLNAWDFVNLFFMRNASSLSVSENQQLFDQLKNIGRLETYATYINSMFTASVMFAVLWTSNEDFKYSLWIVPFLVMLIAPLLAILYIRSEIKRDKLTYKKFALCQLLVLPCAVVGWGMMGLYLAPSHGVSLPISLGIIFATTVYAVIWFKTFPLGTVIWTLLLGGVMLHVYSGGVNLLTGPVNFLYENDKTPEISKLFIIMLGMGTIGVAIYLFCADVTAQLIRIAADKYQALNQLLVDTFERNSTDFLWQANTAGEITYASPKFMDILKAQAENKVMVEHKVLLNSDDQLGASIKDYVLRGKSFEFVFAKLELEGAMGYWVITGDPLFDGKNNQIGFSGFGTDITAIHQVERRKNQVDNFHTMTRMASMIGHDFNNYLATIVACLDIIHHKPHDLEGVERHLILASDAVKAAEDMTTQLLDLEESVSGSIKRINLYDMLDKVINETKAVYPYGLEINLNIPENIHIHADVIQFSRSARNVLENAAQAMNSVGSVDIEVTLLKASSSRIKKYLYGKGAAISEQYVIISFSDTGPGFLEDKLGEIFEPFITTKSRKQSRGLGLAMVENFCLQLHGCVVARNGKNGAIIEMVLPMKNEEIASMGIDKSSQELTTLEY